MQNTIDAWRVDHPMALRANDKQPPCEFANAINHEFYPGSVESTILGLSQVAAGFYGVMLSSVRALYPSCDIDAISKACFRSIGNIKAAEYLAKGDGKLVPLFRDCRGVVMTLLLAIHNASPEYVYDVKEFGPTRAVVHLSGRDRYYRVANLLGVTDLLEWPTLTPFFIGAAETLGIACEVTSHVTYTNGTDILEASYLIERAVAGPDQ
jgi:hypothetical protein